LNPFKSCGCGVTHVGGDDRHYLYVHIGILDYAYLESDFYPYLTRFIGCGLERRVMFGSDNMVWPDAIPITVERLQEARFLTARQKNLIAHDNIAHFLRIEG
jgi:predicted TIM-barrel fold metal-dependent hydrolase